MNAVFIDPGRLRTELALEQATLAGDGMGGHGESWAEIGTVFALVEPLRADRRVDADQAQEAMSHRVTLRFRADLASGMRFRRATRILAIRTVHDPDDSGRYLVCRTVEEGQ